MVLKVDNVLYKIPNGHVVYKDLTFSLELGEFMGILGKNGAGKTTLLDMLMGYRPITSGEIKILDEDPMSFHRRNKQNVVILSHDIQIQKSFSVRNYLDFNSFFYDSYNKKREKELLGFFDINSDSKMGALSTGQQVKAQVISALSCSPKLMLMDEVTAVLDPESRKNFFQLMKEMHAQKECSLLLATNIAEDLVGVADKILFIDKTDAKVYPVDKIDELFNLKEGA